MTETLSARYVLEYPYHRSTGPIIGRFLAGLRDGKVFGVRSAEGRVLVPPMEYDPATGAALDNFIEVGTSGTVMSWTWIAEPRANHPLQHAFAFALVKLDGAGTSILHLLDVRDEARIATGMRVRIRWAAERQGARFPAGLSGSGNVGFLDSSTGTASAACVLLFEYQVELRMGELLASDPPFEHRRKQ